MSEAPKSSRRTLVILLALFFAPLAAAFFLYYQTGWRPAGSSIHGELLQPLKQVPQAAVALVEGPTPDAANWALVYFGDGQCDEACRSALVFARQTRLSLGKDMVRVNRALVATANCCDLAYIDKEQVGTKVFDVSSPADADELRAVLPAGDLSPWLFVVDPLGNIVMRYDVRKEPGDFLKDLKTLLKLSHIG
jgi:hypothetical protein